MHKDAVAVEYGPHGEVRKLVPVIGMGAPNTVIWQDGNSQPCDPPEHLADAWAVIAAWINGHAPDQPPIG